jgi:hypothetical protein
MSLGAGEEVRFYLNLLKNNWLGPKYDLPKIPGPPGYWGAGEGAVGGAVNLAVLGGTGPAQGYQGHQDTGEQVRGVVGGAAVLAAV